MTTILSRRLLPKQTDQYILVLREDQVYIRVGDEYLRKRYFSTQDAERILKKSGSAVHKLCCKLGIQAKASKGRHIRITLSQLRKMAEL